mmetsp:Transcript_1735/g.5578  ORF Transcript_1735/g.5578 Transcript_1735/m.5578 type:complete len:248 (+) Transcript_1735:27-770(+)
MDANQPNIDEVLRLARRMLKDSRPPNTPRINPTNVCAIKCECGTTPGGSTFPKIEPLSTLLGRLNILLNRRPDDGVSDSSAIGLSVDQADTVVAWHKTSREILQSLVSTFGPDEIDAIVEETRDSLINDGENPPKWLLHMLVHMSDNCEEQTVPLLDQHIATLRAHPCVEQCVYRLCCAEKVALTQHETCACPGIVLYTRLSMCVYCDPWASRTIARGREPREWHKYKLGYIESDNATTAWLAQSPH